MSRSRSYSKCSNKIVGRKSKAFLGRVLRIEGLWIIVNRISMSKNTPICDEIVTAVENGTSQNCYCFWLLAVMPASSRFYIHACKTRLVKPTMHNTSICKISFDQDKQKLADVSFVYTTPDKALLTCTTTSWACMARPLTSASMAFIYRIKLQTYDSLSAPYVYRPG